MTKSIFIVLFLGFYTITTAQIQTVQFNARQLQFDNGKALPAEKSFLISAEVPSSIDFVKMQLSNLGFDRNKILFESVWSRKDKDKGIVAILSNNYKLKSGREYNFRFLYYRKIQETERQEVNTMLTVSMQSYLKSNIQVKDDRYIFLRSPRDIYTSLNGILSEGMVNYEIFQGGNHPKISGIIENMLENLAKEKVDPDTTGINSINRFETLLQQLNNEVSIIANYYQYVLKDEITVLDYPTESLMNTLAINAGFAGIYASGDVADFEYYSGPFIGISFPLGNRVYNNDFISNTSISAGVFLKNFETPELNKVSGPVIGLPMYVSAGYRVLKFIRLQAGVTILEETDQITDSKSVYLKTFVGVSLEFQMWIGLDSK
jgi:hypothetical protein